MGQLDQVRKLTRKVRHRSVKVLRRRPNPFLAEVERPLLVHCSHHKAGTIWLHSMLDSVADRYELKQDHYGRRLATLADGTTDFVQSNATVPADVDVVHFPGSMFDARIVGGRPYRGSHLIRDPRDMVVSGYHYHRRTDEDWVHMPREELDGRTYQEELNRLPEVDGLLLEIQYFARHRLPQMVEWDYGQAAFVELRYEQLRADPQAELQRIFTHFGFSPEAIEQSCEVALTRSGETAKSSHVRSGAPGEWRTTFTADHLAAFKAATGDAVIRLGYETDPNWS